jgi:hypothetical protein
MTKDAKIAELEAVLAQFLQPIRNLPLPLVIKALCDNEVLPIDKGSEADIDLINALKRAAVRVGEEVRNNPIKRNRPNEVGNDIEPYVMKAIADEGLRVERPRSKNGRGQQVGYPDIIVFDRHDRPTYVECKIFGDGNALSTMRSFYLSPSENFKVCHDARHLLLAFAVTREPIDGSRDSFYRAESFKLLDLSGLKCDVKYEFNSDNRRLYAPELIVAHGPV